MTCEQAIKNRLTSVKDALGDHAELYDLFERCFLNTIQTTVQQSPGDTFVITGDIPAMWLRDSSAQVLHYVRFADEEPVGKMIEGVIARQAACILRDPYANAFNREMSSFKPYDDTPRASDWVWERKYELDSLCYPIWLAKAYYDATHSTGFLNDAFHRALKTSVSVMRTEQRHDQSPYRFTRRDCPPSDTLHHDGMGEPVAFTGMTWSGFRPSDDACRYGYLVPSNLFAVKALRDAAALADVMKDVDLAAEARALSEEIASGIREFAIVRHSAFGDIYCYETDGLGNYVLMDDANVPSLLSLPYLKACSMDDAVYQNTRRFVLSAENPYYYTGKSARGVGSPHSPEGYIWPIALCVQAMTTDDDEEVARIIRMLIGGHAGTGYMHESFDPDQPENFTRPWFAWANSMFGEMIYRLYESGRLIKVIS